MRHIDRTVTKEQAAVQCLTVNTAIELGKKLLEVCIDSKERFSETEFLIQSKK